MTNHNSMHLGNEWKTRFENQEEINRHLARQIIQLEKDIDQAKEEQKAGRDNLILLFSWTIQILIYLAKTRAAKADPNEVRDKVKNTDRLGHDCFRTNLI
jgi:hypothetical protein